ncbi:MAG TPA: DeoR/GlpR family DNA-binding transcription regulator [Tepidisphaeraceae bacterium]|nr:DeoR/GlpR family DNA-binding transcription regulator [Tepidisphaeraceae bacterium]HUB24387.1 DeoR/GlpR family DNA-binding transcription regulator [Tepidisphaeraceae bacterium]
MLIEERQSRLKEQLARQGMCDLDSLAKALGVSQSTVRRDVEALAADGLARRTHGGVIWLGERSGPARSYIFDQRLDDHQDAKRQIARTAAELVQPGQTVLIDGGTTTYYLAEALAGRSLQLVTNSLPIAQIFLNDEKVEVILTGGLLYPRYGVFLGPNAESMLETIHASMLFLSVAGIHQSHLYNQNLLLVHSERRMMEQAQQIILLADHDKFGQQALVRLCDLNEVDIVVSDSKLPEAEQEAVRQAGCELILAH